MAGDYLPPVVAEILLRTQGFKAAAAEVKAEMAAASEGVSTSAKRMADDVDKSARKVEESSSRMSGRVGGAMQSLGGAIGGVVGAPMQKLGEHMDQLDTKGKKLSGTLAEVGKVATVGGLAGFAAAAYEGVKASEKFQNSLAAIAADSTAKNASAIGNAFLDTMGKSVFSAQQMAQAYSQVSQQLAVTEGHFLNAAQASKVMAAASDLAEGAQTSLGQATQAVAQTMQAYHLSTSQAAQAADMLYSTSRATNTGVGEIAQALGRLHARLGQLAPTMQDVAGLMLAAGQHGLTGSRGIMVMQTALQTLVGGTKQSASVLDALGAHIFNSQGHFIGLQGVIAELQPKFAQMTQAQQEFAAKSLFGASAANVMLQVLKDGPAAFQADAAAADKAGAAHKAAEAQSKTFQHQIETLKATLDDLAIRLGGFLIPKLQDLASMVSSVIGWFQKHQEAAKLLAGVILGVLGAAITAFIAQKAQGLITAVGKMGEAFLGMGRQATATAATVAAEGDAMVASADTTAAGVDAALGSTGIGLILVGVGIAASELATNWSSIWGGIKSVTVSFANDIIGVVNSIIDALNSVIKSYDSVVSSIPLIGGSLTIGTIGHIGAISTGSSGGTGVVPTGAGGLSATALLNPGTLSTGGGGAGAGISGLPASYGAGAGNPAVGGLMGGSGGSGGSRGGRGHGGVVGNVPGLSAAQNAVARQLFGYFTSQGLSAAGASAIIGNWVQESSLNPAEPGGLLAQWGGSRLTAEGAFAASHGLSPTSVGAQAGFAMSELQSGYPSLLAMLRTTGDPRAAALAISNQYERPAAWAANNPNRMNQAAAVFGALSGSGPASVGGGPSSLATSIANSVASLMQKLATQAGNILKTLGDAIQNGTAKTLENVLGVSTGGRMQTTGVGWLNVTTGRRNARPGYASTSTVLHNLIEGVNTGALEGQLTAGQAPTSLDNALVPLLTKLSGGSPQGKSFAALVSSLRATGQGGLASQLVAQEKAALATLAQQLYAEQVTKDAESLKLQATQQTDQTKLIADTAKAQLQVVTDAQNLIVQAVQAGTQHIQDMTAVISAQFQQAAQSIQDATTLMADSSNAHVQAAQDQTQITVDTLGEKGQYGLGLVAQQLQVQLDVLKSGFDQQIAAAQLNVDATKAQWNTQISQLQVAAAQTTLQQNSLVALAQQNATMVQLHGDMLIANATAKADTVQLAQDIKVTLAQTAVDLSATAPAAQQKIAQAVLNQAQAGQSKAMAAANATLSSVQTSANAQINSAQHAYTIAQQTAAQVEAGAQQAIAVAQGQASVAEATAQQGLQAIQDTAAGQENVIQGQIDVTNAQQQAIQRGGGTFNPYSTLMVGGNGLISLIGGGGPLPWQSTGEPGGGAGTQISQEFNLNTSSDPMQTAQELYWLMRPYLSAPH